jgi:hypothetical protein
MNIVQIEANLQALVERFSAQDFVFDLLSAYDLPKATITLLRKGQHNLSKQEGRTILKRKLFFQEVTNADLHETIDTLQKDSATMRHDPRFIVVTDYKTLLASDTKTGEHLDIPILDIAKHYDFFLPWAGIEKHRHASENPADRKAAEKMARLYDEILAENTISNDGQRVHDLNVFLSRILFCFFAEDTEIFEANLFTDSVASHTQENGSDFGSYLDTLFDVLNSEDRSKYPQFLQKFPYVNGGLFAQKHWIPTFSSKSRKIIIECGELDWSKINPDIFGSMMQAVVHQTERGSLGMHYTSVPNIMKVIGPLFLNDLRETFEEYRGNKKKLEELLNRIKRIKFFDPACGSGNFLIITLKELRRLEMDIIKALGAFAFPGIGLSQFYGIEIDDFAHEIAKLSLYLAQHQMNIEFRQTFGKVNPTLPLKTGGNIVCANATRIDWKDVCSNSKEDEIYVLGNPPYLGFLQQNKYQKKDMDIVFENIETIKKLDYISCWFYKGAEYIKGDGNAELAFVSTNSICQGEQVALLWPHILTGGLEIGFACLSFKWTNNAKKNAGVICIVVGLRMESEKMKYIYKNNVKTLVKNINAYLAPSANIYVGKLAKPISSLPRISLGSSAYDGGHLMLTKDERNEIVYNFPDAIKLIRRFVGSAEFFKGIERYCLWIGDDQLALAESIPPIKKRLDSVVEFRNKSKRKLTKETAKTPHLFTENRHIERPAILIPIVSSERREYYACGFLKGDEIIPNSARAIYDPELYVFGVVSSKMHMAWVRAVAGRLKTDYRYSAGVCYNSFPLPFVTTKQKEEIERHVYNILEEREKYPEKTVAQLYDPDKMPAGLKEAHHGLDLAIERCYRSKPFIDDEERLVYLFKLYEQMIAEEKAKNNAK